MKLHKLGTAVPRVKMNSVIHSKNVLFVLAPILGLVCLAANALGQQASGREITFPTTIQWNKQKGVTRYRLQIAIDERFRDVVFDTPIKGERYVVNSLPSGHYYWRVMPVGSRWDSYSRPVRFFVSGGVITRVKMSEPPALVGGAARLRRRF